MAESESYTRRDLYAFFELRMSQRIDILKRHGLYELQRERPTFEHHKDALIRAKEAGKLDAVLADVRAIHAAVEK